MFSLQFQSESSSASVEDDCARQLGNLKGSMVNGWSSSANPWQAWPKAYPNAIPTGTATAFPTCMYLQNE